MAVREVDLETWPRAAAYRLFRSYAQPHFSITTRLDVTHMLSLKPSGVSPFRACLFAIATGFHTVPEMRTRFEGDRVFEYDRLTLSPTIATPDGTFGFGYIDYDPDWITFDKAATAEIAAVRDGAERGPDALGHNGMLYMSCQPWLDYTAFTNPFRGPDDCIPRLSWGRFVKDPDGRMRCAFTAEIHHAIADGFHLAKAISVIQDTLDAL